VADWDVTSPADTAIVSQYPANARTARAAVRTNFGIDHQETDGATVGMHQAIRMLVQGSDPASAAGRGVLYTKEVSGVVELHFRDSAGAVLQITSAGVARLLATTNTWTGANTFSHASNNFTGVGTGLTALNASNLGSGTVASARISGSYTGITGTGALNAGSISSGFGNINIGSSVFTGVGSGLTTLNASNISSGTLAIARHAAVALRNVTSGQDSGSVTVSTSDPSGGSNGDIWLKREA
jgi:hypothetical protein